MHGTSAARGRALGWRFVCAFSLVAAVAVSALFGCRDELVDDIDTNRAPDTYLTGAPAESTTAIYRVHLYWTGNDLDGIVTGYEYAVTDSLPGAADTLDYAYTTRTDSIFLIPVSEGSQVLGHRFYVRAIDNEDAVDPTPAFTFFGVADPTPPKPYFTLAEAWVGSLEEPTWTMDLDDSTNTRVPADTIPAGANVRFRWSGVDLDMALDEYGNTVHIGRVTGYEYFLFPGQAPVRGGPADTMASYTGLQDGKYEFRLKAFDDAGFAGLDPALRTFVWNYDPQTFFLPGEGGTRPHCIVTSDAWPGEEREYFPGDTIPLVGKPTGFGVYTVTIRMSVDGHDPDDILGTGVSNFEWRGSAGAWTPLPGTVRQITQTSTRGDNFSFEARCQDGYGRKDGSPPKFRIYVDRAPVLRDTISVDPLRLQFPRAHEVIPRDSLVAWGNKLPVRVIAQDPDATGRLYDYQFRLRGGIFTPRDPIRPAQNQPAELLMDFDPTWGPGSYTLEVKIAERGSGLRSNQVKVGFTVVP